MTSLPMIGICLAGEPGTPGEPVSSIRTVRNGAGGRSTSVDTIERIIEILFVCGRDAYFGEPVTLLEHVLQTAALAEQNEAPDALVVAALLHDIGHLLDGPADHIGYHGVDDHHEEAGENWLNRHFSRAVTEPIRLHVAAKRYLCTADPSYLDTLSAASLESLARQGWPMTAAESATFRQMPWACDAMILRRWDDAAKTPGKLVPGLAHYRLHLERELVWTAGKRLAQVH
jgi:phosphonate degradation associated HDIG domain protein